MRKPKVSIIILNYNTKELLRNCIDSIIKSTKINYEIIVVDNGSTDDSVQMIEENYKEIVLIKNKSNLGFSAGNNKARTKVKGKFVLFLNSDTIIKEDSIDKSVAYFENLSNVGALTVKQVLLNGTLDKDSRRSFPTPWVTFTHFSRLDRIFPKSRIFSQYWYGYLPADKTHPVDALQGSYFLTTKKILDEVDWFSEDYFLDGEDIDLSWKIKQLGYRLIYYPKVEIVHLKGATKKKNKKLKLKEKKERQKYVLAGIEAMLIFYKKHLWQKYPIYINYSVLTGINLLKIFRLIRLYIF